MQRVDAARGWQRNEAWMATCGCVRVNAARSSGQLQRGGNDIDKLDWFPNYYYNTSSNDNENSSLFNYFNTNTNNKHAHMILFYILPPGMGEGELCTCHVECACVCVCSSVMFSHENMGECQNCRS